MPWATVEQVTAIVGAPVDAEMRDCLAASHAHITTHIRPDLDPNGPQDDGISRGEATYAAGMWKQRAASNGYAVDPAMTTYEGGELTRSALMLLGYRKPVAR